MVTAIILLNVERDKVNEVARKLVDMQEISEAYSVSGRYDLAAIIRVKENEQLADAITAKLLKIEGILKTETLIAFRAYSRHDLECMFSIGLD
jgi:DNA-binding Lrp family transcriptional regulator